MSKSVSFGTPVVVLRMSAGYVPGQTRWWVSYCEGMNIRKGSTVSWSWGNGSAAGKVIAVHRDKVTRTIKGSEITRNGSDEDPAYEIEQQDGAKVLKLRSEVERD